MSQLSHPNHPQSGGEVEVLNRKIKQIVAKTVNGNRIDQLRRRDDALCAYHTSVKTPIGM